MDDGARPTRSTGPLGEAAAWNVLAYLISGPALYGGLGWAADRWLGTSPVFVLLGLLGGMALALYLVWVRYGAQHNRPPAASPDTADDE
jgi:F0F1-type ATP synthase assembly protein I